MRLRPGAETRVQREMREKCSARARYYMKKAGHEPTITASLFGHGVCRRLGCFLRVDASGPTVVWRWGGVESIARTPPSCPTQEEWEAE